MSTIKLEAGKQYKTRDGRIATELYFDEEYGVYRGTMIPDMPCVWYKNGRYTTCLTVDSNADLVVEVREPQEITLIRLKNGCLSRDVYGYYKPYASNPEKPVRFREVIE